MESTMILHEIIRELHIKKNGIIFKINFEKAYDKVNWEFFTTNIKTKGF